MPEKFQIRIGHRISSASSDYEVQKLLGCGAYGAVTQCKKMSTNETVALKILKRKGLQGREKEEERILRKMKTLNSDKFNIISLNDTFTFQERFCLEFEKLDISLHDFLQRMHNNQLDLIEIRPIVQQLATALQFLESAGIVHADLKPENIMMVDHVRKPLRVKVIDFGLAHDDPWRWTGATFQTLWYRSPEVLLGAPFDEAIDTWSLGCIAAEMLMGKELLPAYDENDMMRHIVSTIGRPPQRLLTQGLYTEQFFPIYKGLDRLYWSFMSSPEVNIPTYTNPCTVTSLRDLVQPRKHFGEDGRADECDHERFLDLLTKMLAVDPSQRITPGQILQHPFITMSHLVGTFNNSFHVKMCVKQMSSCQDVSSGDEDNSAQENPKQGTSNRTDTPAPYSVPDKGHPAGPSGQEQPSLQGATKSPARKRKGDALSPDTASPKKRRSKCLDVVQVEEGRKKKRKRDGEDDATPCGRSTDTTPPTKRRNGCQDEDGIATGRTQKRKRDGEDDATLCGRSTDTTPPMKRRNRCQDADPVDTGRKQKRKRDSDDVTVCDRNPDPSPPNKRRNECTPMKTGEKRKRDDGDQCVPSDGNSPSKQQKTVGLKEQMINGLRRLLSNKRPRVQRD